MPTTAEQLAAVLLFIGNELLVRLDDHQTLALVHAWLHRPEIQTLASGNPATRVMLSDTIEIATYRAIRFGMVTFEHAVSVGDIPPMAPENAAGLDGV